MNYYSDVVLNSVIQYLQQKKELSVLERDILSTASKYNEKLFDREGVELKIAENYAKYPDIYAAIVLAPGTHTEQIKQCSEEVLKNNLYMQLVALCSKEQEVLKSNDCQDGRWG
jgi:hypothetical protein